MSIFGGIKHNIKKKGYCKIVELLKNCVNKEPFD